ncbi:hypothetical protein BBP40_004872 [Aspergillus hancockii]|nr:hypothetical protein BBP40_004872 [Aspergillus hancockii]
MHGIAQVNQRGVIQAYRNLYRQGLKVINYSTPSRHVLLQTLRSSFRSSSSHDFDPRRIANTLHFLQRAADVAGLEHKIVKNLMMVRYWEQPQTRKDLRLGSGLKDLVIRQQISGRFRPLIVTCFACLPVPASLRDHQFLASATDFQQLHLLNISTAYVSSRIKCCLRPSMSGLITSLLIEPVVRQARRLSQQTEQSHPPSTLDQPEPPSIQNSNCLTRNEDDSYNIARTSMSHPEQERHPIVGLHEEYAGSDDNPSFSTVPSTAGRNDQNHETELLSLLQQPRYMSDNVTSEDPSRHAVIMHGMDWAEPSLAPSVIIPTRNATQQSSQTPRETDRVSHSHLGVYETGGQFSLPEDDGMGALRQKIHAVRDLKYSSAEQARMIHELMTENYNASQSNLYSHLVQTVPSQSRTQSPDRPVTPNHRWSGLPLDQQFINPATAASIALQEKRYSLTAEDLKPTFFPKEEQESPIDDVDDTDAEEFEEACLGCRHYKRNVKLQCYACKKCFRASPNPRLNSPMSAEPNGRFSSYSITRGRAVSPVISNYFGIPPERGSERPKSTSLFGDRTLKENENEDGGEIRFWGSKFKYRYGFLGRTSETNGEQANEEAGAGDDGRSWCSNSDEDKEDGESGDGGDDDDEEEEDDDESIDIFGHR